MREIIIKTRKQMGVSDEALYTLNDELVKMWHEQGYEAPWLHFSLEKFLASIRGMTVFVALDAMTGELLGMHCFKSHRRQKWCYGSNLSIIPSARREGVASRMLSYEIGLMRQAGYRYIEGMTATTAEWSVRWHFKNGYRIVGYLRSPNDNFAKYVFRKQLIPVCFSSPSTIVFILRHPVYALHSSATFCFFRFSLSYTITRLTKDSNGHDTLLGRLARWALRRKG